MKKITILSVVAAVVLFTGCGEKTKESAADAATKAVESTKEAASHAADATKEATDKAVKAVKEAGDSAGKAADQAVDSAKEGVAAAADTVATTVADTVTNVAGAAAYAKCAGCHGADGKTQALGKSPAIAGQSKETLVTMLNGYKAGTINVSGMGTLMKGQVASMSDADIDAVATYISTLK